MSHSPSSQDESFLGSDPDYSPEPSTSSGQRGRARGRLSARGQAIRGRGSRGGRRGARGTGRAGRSRRRGAAVNLGQDDVLRVENLQALRIADEQARIQSLDLQMSHNLLQLCLTRDPSLMFDLLTMSSADPPPSGPQVRDKPTWCICHNCREMQTDVERKCCGQQPHSCIAMLPHIEAYILQEGHLRLAIRIWNDVQALDDLPDPGESNKQFRSAAYRQFVVWQYGALGAGNRVVLPSCCVWKIRDRFPDPHGQYKGFIPNRLQ